jgi:hypothetical protein
MAARLQDYCAETVPQPGTGAITCPGTATAGGKTFANSFANGDTIFYQLIAGSQLEFGIGTFNATAGTIARTTVLWNSAGTTSPLNIVVACVCVCQLPATRGAWLDDQQRFLMSQQPSVQQDILQVARVDGTFKWGAHFNENSWTPIVWDTLIQNQTGMSAAGQSSFIIPTTGLYKLSCYTYCNGSNIGAGNGGSGSASQMSNAILGFFLDGVLLTESMNNQNRFPQMFDVGGTGELIQPYLFDSYVNMNYTMYAAAGQNLVVQAKAIDAKVPTQVGGWMGSIWQSLLQQVQVIGGSGATLQQHNPSEFRIMRISM